jgi:ankyrin repeat protein
VSLFRTVQILSMNQKKDPTDNQTLFQGIIAGDLKAVKVSVGAGASIHGKDKWQRTPLILASQLGETAIVRFLIDQGAYVNSINANLETALHWAARFGQLETVELLIAKGANVDVKDRGSNTPIHWAIRHGQSKVVLVLKQAELNRKSGSNLSLNETIHKDPGADS